MAVPQSYCRASIFPDNLFLLCPERGVPEKPGIATIRLQWNLKPKMMPRESLSVGSLEISFRASRQR
jgi:hypothetical protein